MAGLLAGLTMLLGGCPAPAITENPLNTPDEGPLVVSVCYAPGVTDFEKEIIPVAVEACREGGAPVERPRKWKRTFFLNDCPLLKTMRIAYICEAEAAAAATAPD